MATKSFLKNIVIKDKKDAEKKKSKEVTINQRVEEVKDPKQIRKLFEGQ